MMTSSIIMNTRVLQSPVTGVQRYVLELLERFGDKVTTISPRRSLAGVKGHFWEQFVLPWMTYRNVLFSPANTGPLVVDKQIITLHDVVPLDHPEWLNKTFADWYRFLMPRLAQRAAHIITVSEFSKERILAHTKMNENQITVIYNGVDVRFKPISQDEIFERLAKLNLPSRYYMLSVGSLEPRKNLTRLLQAWSRVQRIMPEEFWLVLTGKRGDERIFADVSGLNALPPRVHLTGHVPDDVLPALYAGATVFVYPSTYEGFGLPLLEAMASGVPVLTSNRASLPEVVGDAGLMVDPYDVEAIADGLKRLIEDEALRINLREKGLKRAALFSWDKTAQQTWNVLQEVVAS